MNKKEFATFAMALRTYYPRENVLPNDKAVELWFMQLADIPYPVAEAGLNKWVTLNKWSPSIADIREMACEVSQNEFPEWGEAWEEVLYAIRKYGSYRSREALDSLKPLTRKVTERIGFKNLCMSENQMADRASFRMIYEHMAERAKREGQMPQQLKDVIGKIKEQKLIEEG